MSAATSPGRIVVGIDASSESRDALRWAYDRAKATGQELDLVHAWSWPITLLPLDAAAFSLPPTDDVEQAAGDLVNGIVADVFGTSHDGPAMVTHVAEANPADLILRTSSGADLIVTGNRGHGTIRSALLGSVSRQVVHHAEIPVAVVGQKSDDHLDDAPKGRIVVGFDESDASMQAATWAIAEAERRGAELLVVQAWQYPALQAAAISIGNVLPPAGMMTDATQEALDDAMGRIETPEGLQIQTLAVEGSASHVLIAEAAKADLLIIGARGSGGFAGLTLGSTANRALVHSPVPVVVVPAADKG